MQTDRGLHLISFIDGTFDVFLNGNKLVSGIYTLEPSTWGVDVKSNRPQNLYMEFGFEREFQGLSYDISANELVLSDTGWNPVTRWGYDRHFALGKYKRSTELSGQGNPLIGAWRQDFKDDDGNNEAEIFRFYPDGTGTLFIFPTGRRTGLGSNMAHFIDLSYKMGTAPGTGQVTLSRTTLRFEAGREIWEDVVLAVYPFAIDGNVLRMEFEEGTGEYRKR